MVQKLPPKTNNIMNTKTVQISDLDDVVVYTSLGFVLMALVLILFFYFSRKKIIQYELDRRDMIIVHQKQLLSSIINTQELERKRIAQDLHDDISSNLNIVSLNSYFLLKENLSATETNEITKNIINLTKKSLDNSRRIAHDLYPPVLEKFGLEAGIREICYDFSTTKAVSIDFKNDVDFKNVSQENQVQIFRILQELISNSMRHGKAKNINIHFKASEDKKMFCEYTDNGIGFDAKLSENQKGLGMKNIESRIEFIGGFIEFESKPNKGLKVTFSFI